MEVSQRSIKKRFVLNNASFMFIVCYIYAIVFKQLFLYLYPRLCNQKISTKLSLVPAIPDFEALNIPTTPSKIVNHLKKKKETRQTSSYYTVIEMLIRQIVHQSISLYPTIVSLVQLFLGSL